MENLCEINVEKVKVGYDDRFVVLRSDKSKKIYIPDPESILSVYVLSAKKVEDSHEDMAETFVKTSKVLGDNLLSEYEKFKAKEHNNSFKDFLTWCYSSLTVAGKGASEEAEMVCADETKITKKIINEYLLLGYKMKAPKSSIYSGGSYGG